MKLHGLAVSNYYNIAKLALLEKHIEFDEVAISPSQEPEFLLNSPMGKIPVLQDGTYYLSESQAILFYLELLKPTPRLYPLDPMISGRAQQIHQFIDLYIDEPARRLLGAAFFGQETDAESVESIGKELKHNVAALSQIAGFSPFIAGPDLSHADLAAFTTFGFAQAIMERLHGPDPMSKLPGVGAYMEMMEKRPSCQQVVEDQLLALDKMLSANA
ncbi:MAG: glutathione S-transferase family protein [Motiliproteus sp.]|nr:glutathione S-transferase family protein [Motiliproteus sp.]MCW9053366.1 glutathione S-transferase family protein [Motiliproteus sp.]